jgi:hypothetical protein
MSWMTKHTKNLLGYMPIDNKASALNHTSFPVHQHSHSAIDPDAPGVPGTPGYEPKVKRSELDTKGKEIFDANKKRYGSITKSISRIKAKPIDGPKPKGIVKL